MKRWISTLWMILGLGLGATQAQNTADAACFASLQAEDAALPDLVEYYDAYGYIAGLAPDWPYTLNGFLFPNDDPADSTLLFINLLFEAPEDFWLGTARRLGLAVAPEVSQNCADSNGENTWALYAFEATWRGESTQVQAAFSEVPEGTLAVLLFSATEADAATADEARLLFLAVVDALEAIPLESE